MVDDPSFAPLFFRYPVFRFGDFYVDNAMVFGGVTVDDTVSWVFTVVKEYQKIDKEGNYPVLSATAVRAVYVLDDGKISEDWISLFMKTMASWEAKNGTQVFYQTSTSLAKEMERNGDVNYSFI